MSLPTNLNETPKLELRIPLSPRESDMRMLRILLESMQLNGGPIARAAHCVVSVSAECPLRDLKKDYPWTEEHSVEFRWVDPEVFEKWVYDGTGSDRFWIESDADIVATIDCDLLIAGDFDSIVMDAYQNQCMLGFIAHVSPFGFKGYGEISGDEKWREVYTAVGLPEPRFDFQYTGWGLDFAEMMGVPGEQIFSYRPDHRYCPPYYNAGVILGPRRYFEAIGETFNDDYELVRGVIKSVFSWQVAHCVALDRHQIPCKTIPINYNFPMNLPADAMRSVNPDPNGEDRNEDIKIFHCIGQRALFESGESVAALLDRKDLTGAWPMFQYKLRAVYDRINNA